MILGSLRIQNFRPFEDDTISLANYNCFVGPNGSGKSSILAALNILFRNSAAATDISALTEQDFHRRNTADPIVITATFTELSDEAKEDLSAYVRHDQLVVSAKAEWNSESQSAPVKQYGSRLVMEDFARYFERAKADAYAKELKDIYQSFRTKYGDLPGVTTKADMENALREYEETHPEHCVVRDSEDQFYGWSRGQNRIGKYCQWVFVPAVKDASEEQLEGRNTALGELLQRTIRTRIDFSDSLSDLRSELSERYQELLIREQKVLSDLSDSIQARLQEWAHPGARVELHWHYDRDRSVVLADPVARADVGEGDFLGDLVRLGHGLQRSFIVSLLHELAEADSEGAPTLLLGIEEPELYQHPPQARHLAAVLENLAVEGGQILVTTHSPYFVSGSGFESVRMTRKPWEGGASSVTHLTYEELAESLSEALQEEPASPSAVMAAVEQIMQPSQKELFFSTVPVLVEGLEDIAFVSTYLQLTDRWHEFRKYGCHFVVANGKGQMSRLLAIANGLGMQSFVIFDGDGDDSQHESSHRRDNGCLLRLCGCNAAETFPNETYWSDRLVMWKSTIGKVVREEIGEAVWNAADGKARKRHGLQDGVKRKNTLLIAATLEVLKQDETQSEVLDELCRHILTYAEAG